MAACQIYSCCVQQLNAIIKDYVWVQKQYLAVYVILDTMEETAKNVILKILIFTFGM
jgi:hypothetical protein